MNKVAIIGAGWVGKAMMELFPNAIVYVRNAGKYTSDSSYPMGINYTTNKDDINGCNIAFICVPTPSMPLETVGSTDDRAEGYLSNEGKLDTSIVEEVIKWLEVETIVIRSTVNPGDCDRWSLKYNKQIVMQPEYLGETPQHPLLDTVATPFLVIGGYIKDRKKLIDLYTEVYNANIKIRQVSNYEAEVIKLSENRAIFFKVAQCQELYDVCEKIGLDYYTIINAVYSDDPRFNLWWTFVYPEKRGITSKCMPKDVYAWAAWAES